MKIKPIILFLLLSSFLLTAEDTTKKPPMKFRGSVYLGAVFYPGHYLNISDGKYSPIATDKLDYSDVGDPQFKHHQSGDPGRIWGDGAFATHGLEGKLFADFTMSAPFLAFNHFLLSDNSIALSLKLAISPVTASVGTEVAFTPIPFLVFRSGFSVSLPYNIPIANGFARNNYTGVYESQEKRLLVEDTAFGPILQNWFNVTFQFDVGALTPKSIQRWTHIVMQCKAEFHHKMMPNIESTIPYQFENDNAENFNGWNFYLDSMIGYKIPVLIDPKFQEINKNMFIGGKRHNNLSVIIGFMANIDEYKLSNNQLSTMASKGWGSDFMTILFGPMALIDLPNNFFTAAMVNWQNERKYTSETVGNADFTQREYVDWYIYFRKITVVFGWNF